MTETEFWKEKERELREKLENEVMNRKINCDLTIGLFDSFYYFCKAKFTSDEGKRRLNLRNVLEDFIKRMLVGINSRETKFRNKIEALQSKGIIDRETKESLQRIWTMSSIEHHPNTSSFNVFTDIWKPLVKLLNLKLSWNIETVNIFSDKYLDELIFDWKRDFANIIISRYGTNISESKAIELSKNDILPEMIPEPKYIEIIKEVPVEKIVEVIREVPIEIIKEVPVEKIVEVIREVPIEIIKEVPIEIIKEVPVEKIVEVIREVPIEIIKEVPVEKIVEVIRENSAINKPKFHSDRIAELTPDQRELILNGIPDDVKKRHFYNGEHYTVSDDKIVLSKEHWKQLRKSKLLYSGGKKPFSSSNGFGKVYASDLAHFTEYSFKNTLAVISKWIGVNFKSIDSKYFEAGKIAEAYILEWASININKISPLFNHETGEVIPTYLDKTFNDGDYKFDWFKNGMSSVLPEFAATPDAMRISDEYGSVYSKNNIIIEVKTTSIKNIENFKRFGLSKQYKLQASYYCYLFGVNNYQFIYYFLTDDDYEKISNGKKIEIKEDQIAVTEIQEVNFSEVEESLLEIKKIRRKIFHNNEINLEDNEFKINSDFQGEAFDLNLQYLKVSNKNENEDFLIGLKMKGN